MSWAYVIVCSNGYDVYRCGDGTEVRCFSEGTYQIDCPADVDLGSISCAEHGGLTSVGPGSGTGVTDYKGTLDFSRLACSNCSGEPPPISYAGWLASCSGKATMACADTDPNCRSKQSAFKALCAQLKGEMKSFWHIDFTPQLACY